jgi:hypothetical protein
MGLLESTYLMHFVLLGSAMRKIEKFWRLARSAANPSPGDIRANRENFRGSALFGPAHPTKIEQIRGVLCGYPQCVNRE